MPIKARLCPLCISAGLTREQAVRVYASRPAAMAIMNAIGLSRTRAISTAIAKQLLTTNSVELLAEQGLDSSSADGEAQPCRPAPGDEHKVRC